MPKNSKRYRALAERQTKEALPLAEAIAKLKGFGTTKFDQTVEIHMRLGIDPKQADQIVRGSIVLPHGIGKIAARGGVRQRRLGRSGHGRRCGRSGAGRFGQEDPGRLVGLRCLHRRARHDGRRGPPG